MIPALISSERDICMRFIHQLVSEVTNDVHRRDSVGRVCVQPWIDALHVVEVQAHR
jgi:hypothetical protein